DLRAVRARLALVARVGAGAGDRPRVRGGQRRAHRPAVGRERGHRVRGHVPAGPAAGARGVSAPAAQVLVVDDEPQIVRGLKVILRAAGYDVRAAATKRGPLAASAARPPAALWLDWVWREGSGGG